MKEKIVVVVVLCSPLRLEVLEMRFLELVCKRLPGRLFSYYRFSGPGARGKGPLTGFPGRINSFFPFDFLASIALPIYEQPGHVSVESGLLKLCKVR